MTGSTHPSWYEPDGLPETLQAALAEEDVSVDEIVSVLAEHELDAPREQIRELVEATPDTFDEADGTEEQTTLDEPREPQSRFFGVQDVPYLSTTEFATVLGAALSRYEGRFSLPDNTDDLGVDVFWNRQHSSVAFQVVPLDPETPVTEETINTDIDGSVTPASGRAPSVVGIVTNTGFTENVEEYASDRDIKLFGREHLGQWLRDSKLTTGVVGKLLDDDDPDSVTISSFEDLPAMPESVRERGPLFDGKSPGQLEGGIAGTSGAGEGGESSGWSIPVVDTPSTPGERGVLYADPKEDGDYSALNDYMNELDPEEEEESK